MKNEDQAIVKLVFKFCYPSKSSKSAVLFTRQKLSENTKGGTRLLTDVQSLTLRIHNAMPIVRHFIKYPKNVIKSHQDET